jgi:hypothetical protein
MQVLLVMPVVVPVLLEALSGLEDARLNYVEQVTARMPCGTAGWLRCTHARLLPATVQVTRVH